ncbi:MAG TPA: hypothetical protein VMW08_13080 [Acidimicrobiales bacterium]|nr:hypothetical protein [Acidimicrobiales bacterium]
MPNQKEDESGLTSMRLNAITLGTPDGSVGLTFHREMTVVTGLDARERAELSARVLRALLGQDEAAEVRYTTFDGQERVVSSAQRETAAAHEWRLQGNVVDDIAHLWRLSLVGRESFLSGDERLEDPPVLIEARRQLVSLELELLELQRAEDKDPSEVRRLAERVTAMARRVNELRASLVSGRRSRDDEALASAAAVLQAKFTAAGSLGIHNERLPVVFDDAFIDAAASRKWDLLDLLRRLATHNQVLYLSGDPFVAAWARSAAEHDRIRLVETDAPVPSTV